MSEQGGKGDPYKLMQNVLHCHTAKPTAEKRLYAWRTNRETTTGQTRREEPITGKF